MLQRVRSQVLAAGGTIAGASSGGTQTPFYESMGYRKGHTAVRLQLTLADPATVRCTLPSSLPDKVRCPPPPINRCMRCWGKAVAGILIACGGNCIVEQPFCVMQYLTLAHY